MKYPINYNYLIIETSISEKWKISYRHIISEKWYDVNNLFFNTVLNNKKSKYNIIIPIETHDIKRKQPSNVIWILVYIYSKIEPFKIITTRVRKQIKKYCYITINSFMYEMQCVCEICDDDWNSSSSKLHVKFSNCKTNAFAHTQLHLTFGYLRSCWSRKLPIFQ